MKKKSLSSTRDELKGRAVSLWERLDVLELEREGFQEGLVGSLSEDIALVSPQSNTGGLSGVYVE